MCRVSPHQKANNKEKWNVPLHGGEKFWRRIRRDRQGGGGKRCNWMRQKTTGLCIGRTQTNLVIHMYEWYRDQTNGCIWAVSNYPFSSFPIKSSPAQVWCSAAHQCIPAQRHNLQKIHRKKHSPQLWFGSQFVLLIWDMVWYFYQCKSRGSIYERDEADFLQLKVYLKQFYQLIDTDFDNLSNLSRYILLSIF